ncbi:MAG: AAA family ATPase [Pirellulaceae bacterium]|nr:AAA family ATPase [Pirellulaceae bacterium]
MTKQAEIQEQADLPSQEQPDSSGNSFVQTCKVIDEAHANKDADAVRDVAVTLAKRLSTAERRLGKATRFQQAAREKLEALTLPAQYPVTIIRVHQNGRLIVEVAGSGNSRVCVSVHPDVNPADLVVGATAVVSSQRNCLLSVTAPEGPWKNVATFERYIGSSDRMLVRDRDAFLVVDQSEALRGTTLTKSDLIGFDRDVSGIAYARLDPPASEHLFDDDVTDDFARLGGLDQPIARVRQIIDFRFRHPHLASKYGLKTKCGILFHGPPGNGKTVMVRSAVSYARRLMPDKRCRFMHTAGSQDNSKWFGESEQNLIERMDAIRAAAKDAIVFAFWDEVDAIARCRGTDLGSGAPDRILNTFLSQLDGMAALENVVLMFATNRADTLDPGFMRAGRVDQKIEIPSPNRRGAKAILERYLGNGLPLASPHDSTDQLVAPLLSRLFAPNGQYARVAEVKLNDGRQLGVAGRHLISGAMLENVVTMAAQHAAVREAETGQEGVTEEDLLFVLNGELTAAVSLLTAANIKNYVATIPKESQPIAVDSLLTSSSSVPAR